MGRLKHIAFVVQRCGREVNGGAEKQCLDVALIMKEEWDIDIITTCAKEYQQWKNSYPEGKEEFQGVNILRFPVAKQRNKQAFDAFSARVNPSFAPVSPSLHRQEKWMRMQGPDSPKLLSYLKHHAEEYDAVFFFTYLYATTYFGMQEVAGKTPCFLVPFAHQEWMLSLSMWDALFASADGLLFSSPEEKSLLQHRFPHLHLKGGIAGSAVLPPEKINPSAFRKQFDLPFPFLLYLGRIEESKGCAEMFHFFLKALPQLPEELHLVLLGEANMNIPSHKRIIPLGFVEEKVKWDALAACELLVLPSRFESLSLVLLEAWASEKPVLVNGDCAVLQQQCERSHGGLWFRDAEEFRAALQLLLHRKRKLQETLGKQGKEYVNKHYTKEALKTAFLTLVQ